jgi:hypothetical protein
MFFVSTYAFLICEVKRKRDYSMLWFAATTMLALMATISFTIWVAAFEFKLGVSPAEPFVTDPGRMGLEPSASSHSSTWVPSSTTRFGGIRK